MVPIAHSTSDAERTSSTPTGTDTPASRKIRRPSLLNPSFHRSGEVPLIGTSRRVEISTSACVTFHGSIRARRPAISASKAVSRCGRSSSFAATERALGSGTSSTWNRPRTSSAPPSPRSEA